MSNIERNTGNANTGNATNGNAPSIPNTSNPSGQYVGCTLHYIRVPERITCDQDYILPVMMSPTSPMSTHARPNYSWHAVDITLQYKVSGSWRDMPDHCTTIRSSFQDIRRSCRGGSCVPYNIKRTAFDNGTECRFSMQIYYRNEAVGVPSYTNSFRLVMYPTIRFVRAVLQHDDRHTLRRNARRDALNPARRTALRTTRRTAPTTSPPTTTRRITRSTSGGNAQ